MQDNIIVFPEPLPDDKAQFVSPALPVSLTSLIGREHEEKEIQALLLRPDVRLLTLTGTAGVGKTRLALEVARDLVHNFSDGVHVVSLAPLSDPAFVIPTLAHSMGLIESGSQPLLEQLKTSQRDKHRLLLLDNFEHVISVAPLLSELLEACPTVKILVTSREVLRLRGEHQFAVPPLALPDPKSIPDDRSLARVPAVKLFIQRAQAIRSDFQLTMDNAAAIAEICLRLDGLPLAIELAAVRIKLLPPQTLLIRLEHRLQVLTGGPRDVPERQLTLRATIAWSYHLLNTQEQQLFRRLSVFVGGCTLEAVEAVCYETQLEALSALSEIALLLDKSLLQQVVYEGEARLTMLETILEYALECLCESGEEESIRREHARYYLALVEEAEPHLKGAQQLLWLRRLDREQENLRVALGWLIAHAEGEKALRFCVSLWLFWQTRGYWSEGWRWLKTVLALPEAGERTVLRAKVLSAAGELAAVQGDVQEAHVLLTESVILCQELHDDYGVVLPMSTLGRVMVQQGDHIAASSLLKECITLCRKLGSTWELSRSLLTLGYVVWLQDDQKQAIALTQESLMLARELGDKTRIAHALNNVGHFFWEQGDLVQARAHAEEGLKLLRELGDKFLLSSTLGTLGSILCSQGDLKQAVVCFTEAYSKTQELGNEFHITEGHSLELERKIHIARHLMGFAMVAIAQQQLIHAARLFAAVEVRLDINKEFGPGERGNLKQTVRNLRAQLGEKAFQRAWSEGRTMTIEQILGNPEEIIMLEPALTGSFPSSMEMYPSGLTPREMDVLRLLAKGLTSAQIAEQLTIGVVTVNFHVRSIYCKLGVTSRSAATRYALEQHLV